MMTIRDFLKDNVIITNTYNIIDYDFFKTRFIARLGGFGVRNDLTATQIIDYSQNVIDVNKDYYTSLLSQTLNPFKTWGEDGTHTDNTTTDNTNTETTDYITKTTGDNTTNSGGDSSATTNNNNLRNSYDATEATPTDNSTTTSTSTYGDTTKITLDTTVTNGGTRTNVIGGTVGNSGTNNKTGWTNADALKTMREYRAAYDIIIDDIAEIIIDAFINIWGW